MVSLKISPFNYCYFLLFRKKPAKGRGLVSTHQLVLIIACRQTQVWQAAQLSIWLSFFCLLTCRIKCMLHKVAWHVIMAFSNWGVKQCPMQDFFNTFMTKFDISNAVHNDRSPRLASTSTLCRIFLTHFWPSLTVVWQPIPFAGFF